MKESFTAKVITDKNEINYLLNITEDDITSSFMYDAFGEFNNKVRFHPYDIITIPKGYYGNDKHKNTNSFTTTVGIWIFNKYFIERDLFDLFKYINQQVNGKLISKIEEEVNYALIEDRITIEQRIRIICKMQKIQPFVAILSYGYTEKMLTCSKAINKKKQELLKKYSKEIEEGDAIVCSKIEQELLDYAKEYLKGDPSLDMFMSGARGSWDNNFKNMFVMKGAIKDYDPTSNKKYNIITSSYIDGVADNEYSTLCKSLAAGPFSRANNTKRGGYWEKLMIPAYSHLVLGPPNSDCGTKDYITVNLTNDNVKLYMYSYIIEGNRLVELNSQNKDKYIGKKVKFRFSSMCQYKNGFCNKCIGNLYYRTNKQNIGCNVSAVPSILKNISMKKFHDSQERVHTMNIMKAFNIK